jgi:uncharacterized protein (TIGR02118 family)
MLKNFSLMKRKEGMSLADFRRWAMEEHPMLAKQLPGLLHYHMSVVLDGQAELPADAVSELWFENMETRAAAFATDAGKAAAADAIAHCSSRTHLLTEEKVIIK